MVIVVEIEDRCFAKPFLGGWRNIVTGREYRDACTQTCPGDYSVVCPTFSKKHRNDRADGSCFVRGTNAIRVSRDCGIGTDRSLLMTILAPYRCKYTSVARETAIQTSSLPDLRDKLITPLAKKSRGTTGRNENANKAPGFSKISSNDEPRDERINECETIYFTRLEEDSAMKIQKCYRAYRSRLEIAALARLSRATRPPTPREPAKIHKFRHCRASQFEILNLVPPKKRSDFEMLDNVLERWRFYANARVDRDLFGTSRLAARTIILQREIEILRSIETTKTRLRDVRRKREYFARLDELAESEVWRAANGTRSIHVDTLRVQRTRECRDFYRALIDPSLASDVRMEILKKLREYAYQHACKYTDDIVSLVDQEIQLFAINYDEKIVKSLRNRLTLALMRLTMNLCAPKRNIVNDETTIAAGKRSSFTKLCKRCGGKLLTNDDRRSSARISSSLKSKILHTCDNCRKSEAGKEAKIVYEPYELMLDDLRIHEAIVAASSSSSINVSPALSVDSRIIYRLVNHIWHGKSAISECNDLYRLVLVRFRSHCEWSPWNNIVLTRHEAALHRSMNDPWNIYSSGIMKKFVVKNLQAKLRFDFNARTRFR